MQFLFLENHSADNKLLYMASFDLQKTFNCVKFHLVDTVKTRK